MHCPNCQLLIPEDDGYFRGVAVYCCEACANHLRCTCNKEATAVGLQKLF